MRLCCAGLHQPLTLLGIGLLVAGVAWALRAKPEPLAAQAHAA